MLLDRCDCSTSDWPSIENTQASHWTWDAPPWSYCTRERVQALLCDLNTRAVNGRFQNLKWFYFKILEKTFYFKLILYVHKYYLSSSIKRCLTECIILSGYLVDVKWKGLHIRNCSKTFKPYLISQRIFMCPYRKMGYMYESLVFINVNWFIYKIIDSLSIQATTIITLCLPLTCSMSIKCWIIEYSCFFSLLR